MGRSSRKAGGTLYHIPFCNQSGMELCNTGCSAPNADMAGNIGISRGARKSRENKNPGRLISPAGESADVRTCVPPQRMTQHTVVRKRREGIGRGLCVRSKGLRCLWSAEAPFRYCFGVTEAVSLAMVRVF